MIVKDKEFVSRHFVFKPLPDGRLAFVGDFESLYKTEEDPWGQRGDDPRLQGYYQFSRSNLIATIKQISTLQNKSMKILEIGSGLGYVTNMLQEALKSQANVSGLDISPTATAKSQKNFPQLTFFNGDIGSAELKLNQFDVVIMAEVLWYVLEKLPQTFKNLLKLLSPQGYLVFSNGFPPEQRYGKEIIHGFDGLVRYVEDNYFQSFKLIKAEADYSRKFLFDDGILVLQKI